MRIEGNVCDAYIDSWTGRSLMNVIVPVIVTRVCDFKR
jgi:hypothetical protein